MHQGTLFQSTWVTTYPHPLCISVHAAVRKQHGPSIQNAAWAPGPSACVYEQYGALFPPQGLHLPHTTLKFDPLHFRCVEMIKHSTYAELASDLEINKAIRYLRDQDLSAATEVLRSFEKKDSKVASAAANNLAFLYYLVRIFVVTHLQAYVYS